MWFMKKIEFLSGKEMKLILAFLKEHFGVNEKFDLGWYLSKERLFCISRDIELINLKDFNVNAAGLYFGEWKNDELRLSIDGSQMIGSFASKNIVELSDEELLAWLRGEDLDKKVENQGLVLILHGNDFVGCGKVKEGKILNFVPKIRRLMTAHPIRHGLEEKHD